MSWTVQRKVNAGKISVQVFLREYDEGPDYGYVQTTNGSAPCGDHPFGQDGPPCPPIYTDLDLDPAESVGGGTWSPYFPNMAGYLEVDTATGAITGLVSGQVGQTLTFTGGQNPRGKVKVVVTVD